MYLLEICLKTTENIGVFFVDRETLQIIRPSDEAENLD